MIVEEQEITRVKIKKIMAIFTASKASVRPHFFLTGPSGSGKTHIVKELVKELNLGFMEINAAQLTKEGTSGNSLSKALAPLSDNHSKYVVCLVDEFDKLFISGNSNLNLAHETTNGVQNEFLTVLESQEADVIGDYGHYKKVKVDNILFIFAGAFNGEEGIDSWRLQELGVKTEFLGRVSLCYNLQKLSVNSLYAALLKSELMDNYLNVFPDVNRQDAEQKIMEAVVYLNDNNDKGVRLLNFLINRFFINDGDLELGKAEEAFKQRNFSTYSFG